MISRPAAFGPLLCLALLAAVAVSAHAQLPEPSQQLGDERSDWVAHARAVSHPIALAGSDFADLRFLADAIGPRRIVQLGESGHGFAEFGTAKARLVRYLHEELGFDVIAFETSQFECAWVRAHLGELTPREAMDRCLVRTLHSEGTAELFEYILDTQSTDRPLRVAGFDIQASTRTSGERPAFWREVLAAADPAFADSVAQLDSTFLDLRFDSERLLAEGAQLAEVYDELAMFMQANRSRQPDGTAWDTGMSLATSSAAYVRQLMASFSGDDFVEIRDEAMAVNIRWLADERFSDSKIITWGHNFHLRHANQQVDPNPVKTTGHWLSQSHRNDLYTIGLYTRWGRGVMPNGQEFNVVPPEPGSLESILGHVGEDALLVDLREVAASEAGAWATRPIVTKTWGQANVTMTLIDQYDAILFVDHVTPP